MVFGMVPGSDGLRTPAGQHRLVRMKRKAETHCIFITGDAQNEQGNMKV